MRLRQEVGERIRARRLELGLTLKQLGERLTNQSGNPIPGTQISKWERGANFPAQRQWAPLAEALAVDLDQLFAGLTGEQAAWSVALEQRVERNEQRLAILSRLLGLEDALDAAAAAPRPDPRQVEQVLESEIAARGREAESAASASAQAASPRRKARSRRRD